MIDLSYFNRQDTLNIFCDASIYKINKETYAGCYGAVAVYMNQKYDEELKVIGNTTNNDSEIKAIRLAVSLAIKHRKRFRFINIFSDSQISVFGIRDRIFNWKVKDGLLYGYNDKPIMNQSAYLEIVDMITRNEIYLNIFHQKGHVLTHLNASVENAAHVFKSSNGIRDDVSRGLIVYLSKWNNVIDNDTRVLLSKGHGSIHDTSPIIYNGIGLQEKLYRFKDLIYSPFYSKY